jgi:hypothetical protein
MGGVINEKLVSARARGLRTSYGEDAVGWGWLFIGVGFWALGQMSYLKVKRPMVKFISWTLAVGAWSVGGWILIRKLVRLVSA